MTKKKILGSIALATFVALGATSCAGTSTSESTGQYVDSAVISTKVNTAIAQDDMLSVFDIDVKTFKNVVQLSGFVNTPAEKAHATTVARTVEGVHSVRNDLVVKGGSSG